MTIQKRLNTWADFLRVPVVDIGTASVLLGVSRQRLVVLVERRKIVAHSLAGKYVLDVASLLAWDQARKARKLSENLTAIAGP